MNAAPRRPCLAPGCPKYRVNCGYCEDHQGRIPVRPQHKETRQVRGYGAAWLKIRSQVLREEPICRTCAANGRTSRATVVHHLDGDQTNNDKANLAPLCRACHERVHGRAG